MKDNNDELVSHFLHSNIQEIEDNGFSERVIRNLPDRYLLISKIIDGICFAACIIMFFVFNGFTTIYKSVISLIESQSNIIPHDINYTSIFIVCAVLLFIGIERIYSIKW